MKWVVLCMVVSCIVDSCIVDSREVGDFVLWFCVEWTRV